MGQRLFPSQIGSIESSGRQWLKLLPLIALSLTSVASAGEAPTQFLSHSPQRLLPVPSKRPLGKGPSRFVDPVRGNDADDGSERSPWKTIQHALPLLDPGGTLYLRGGVYYENIYCALAATADKPITIRSHPGERAVIDGGYREFSEAPASAWVPCEQGVEGEFRSVRAYRNIAGVAGMFGDSRIGLLTYWLLDDLRSANEQWRLDRRKQIMDRPLYCGPGLWYDQRTGYIHCRLARTHNGNPQVADYTGETDPRKLPLVIAPLNSVPLSLDHARHLRLQDLVIRGAGEESVLIRFCADIELDGVIVLCGGIEGRNSGPVRITCSAIYGRIPPWMWRIDSSKGCASSASRDIVRMLTETLLETSHELETPSVPRIIHNDLLAGRAEGLRSIDLNSDDAQMPQMTGYPRNHDWDVAWCDFTEGHDGIFLSGHNMRFRHNLVENMEDDAIDISCALPRETDTVYVEQNLVRRFVSGISTHNYGMGGPRGKAFICRNIFDMSQGTMLIRQNPDHPQGELNSAGAFTIHGADHLKYIESIYFYQNSIVAGIKYPYGFVQGLLGGTRDGSERRVFNNIFVYLDDKCRYPPPFYGVGITNADLEVDGNLHWNPAPPSEAPVGYLDQLRTHPVSASNRQKYPDGLGANDIVGDPKFVAFKPGIPGVNDYRLSAGSAAIGKGVALPADWEDPLRPEEGARPDIGALPFGSEPLRVGIPSNDGDEHEKSGEISRSGRVTWRH